MGFLGFGKSHAADTFDTAYEIGQHIGQVVNELNREAGDNEAVIEWHGVFAETGRQASIEWQARHEFSSLDACEIAETVLDAAYGDADAEDREDFIAGFESKTDPWWKFW